MAAFLVVELECDDIGWTAAYRRDVPGMIARRGARYLSKVQSPEWIEGDRPAAQTMAILEFPSAEEARAFLASDEYRPHAEARRAGARTQIFLLEGAERADNPLQAS